LGFFDFKHKLSLLSSDCEGQSFTPFRENNCVCSLENAHSNDHSFLQAKIDELVEALQHKELQLNESTLRLEDMRKQLAATDHKSFKHWFLSNVVGDSTHTPAVEVCTTNSSTENVRDLVVTLLVQWRDQVGFYPRGATSAITKAEEKFLQNITEFVMESHQRATAAEGQTRSIRSQLNQLEQNHRVKLTQLERAMMQLFK
jgi:hypothetical protein